jgi:hypothetical protein
VKKLDVAAAYGRDHRPDEDLIGCGRDHFEFLQFHPIGFDHDHGF